MFIPLGIKTDYSLHKSLLKINDIIEYALNNKLNIIGILDDNLNSSYNFVLKCNEYNIKPIIGLDFIFDGKHIYLYPKNNDGLSNLFKLNKYVIDNNIDINKLKSFLNDVIIVLPYESIDLFKYFNDAYLSFKNENERKNELILTNNLIYINIYLAKNKESSKYVNYLYLNENNKHLGDIELKDYSNNVLEIKNYDLSNFASNININFSKNKMYIPKYIENSKEYLYNLAKKGLYKRLNNEITDKYLERLDYELDIIYKMGFVDYFLIVFDYVRFAIKNDIAVGVGRGSAVSSLVAYSLGITSIDPLKYDLLFERFLNPKRVTMPDIDIDFEDSKRNLVYEYVLKKYGINNVSKIVAYGTMKAKEVLRIIGRIYDIEDNVISYLSKNIDSKLDLKENLKNPAVKDILSRNQKLNKIYHEAFYLEGLKTHILSHAAGVIISSVDITDIAPIIKNGNDYLVGFTKDEIESLGLIKMDFLSLKTLTIINDITRSIEKNLNKKIDLNKINYNDINVYTIFKNADTNGIFQFESFGMKKFFKELKPNSFDDLIAAVALYRPGPMDSIPAFLEARKTGKIKYIDESLEPILKNTNGVIIYQEQILEILKTIGNYSYQEADIVRKAISKKNIEVIEKNRNEFICKSKLDKNISNKIFDLIVPFSSFGFNKSHSVAYAYLAYQMAYLKYYFKEYFYASILNNDISDSKSRINYINEAKNAGVKFIKPSINKSSLYYKIEENNIILPFKIIKGINTILIEHIENIRGNGFNDIYDFFLKIDKKIINEKCINNLILAGVFDELNINRKTLKNNLDSLYNYADLVHDLGADFVSKPILKEYDDYNNIELMNLDLDMYGFYLTNHPSNKYSDCMKIINIKNNFNKQVIIYVLIDNIKIIKTKNNKDMAFIDVNDETGNISVTTFDDKLPLLENINKGDFVKILGRVEKRLDKYAIILNNIEKITI